MSPNWITTGCVLALLLGVTPACARDRGAGDTIAVAGAVVDTGVAVAVEVPATGGVTLTVAAPAGVGVVLADASGRAVYILEDTAGTADCTSGDCAKSWTPVGQASIAQGDTTVNRSLLGSVRRPDGTQQATYGGKPLYYYQGDQARNDTKGQGRREGGATGRLVNPQGDAVR